MRVLPIAVASILSFTSLAANANSISFEWPSRHSTVICGGSTESGDLKMRVSTGDGVLVGEATDGRVLIYIDLRKPGRVHLAFSEALSDDESAKRDKIVAKLSKEDQELLANLLSSRASEVFMGMTDGYVHYRSDNGSHSFTVSCQENPK